MVKIPSVVAVEDNGYVFAEHQKNLYTVFETPHLT